MKVKTWIVAYWNDYDKKFAFYSSGYIVTSKDAIPVAELELEVEVPSDIELRRRLAEQLEEKKQVVRADAHKECVEIDQQIQELLALPAPMDTTEVQS